MQSSQLPQVIEFKYLGSTLQSDGDICTYEYRDKQEDTVWTEQLEEDARRPRCDKRVPPHVKGKIQMISQR